MASIHRTPPCLAVPCCAFSLTREHPRCLDGPWLARRAQPICLEELEVSTSLMLPCRHQMCRECTRQCWALRQQAQPSTQHLECPLCRQLIHVQKGDLNAFIAANAASNFFAGDPNTPRCRAVLGAGRRPPSTLDNLTLQELKLAVRLLSLQDSLAGAVERHEIEACIEQRIRAPAPEAAVAALPIEVLRALLRGRSVPHGAVSSDREALANLVIRSSRGSCQALPVGTLRAMLREFGHASEAFDDLEKSDLARRVAAARALAHSAGDGGSGGGSSGGGGGNCGGTGARSNRRAGVGASAASVRASRGEVEPAADVTGCGACCVVS